MKSVVLKLFIFTITLFFTKSIVAQSENFELTEENSELINQYVVINKDSMSVSDGYNKVLEWINITYNTPDEVIKSQLKDKYIRIEGVDKSITTQNVIGTMFSYMGKYSLTFQFKENKIKMELTRLQVYNEPSQYSAGGWVDASPIYSLNFKKSGKLKKQYSKYQQGYVDSMNYLKLSLNDYAYNLTKSVVDEEDW